MHESDAARLSEFTRRYEWIWIAGNHDPTMPTWLGGQVADEVRLDDCVFGTKPKKALQWVKCRDIFTRRRESNHGGARYPVDVLRPTAADWSFPHLAHIPAV